MTHSSSTEHPSPGTDKPRPVGRPRIDRSEAPSRIAILDAAQNLFAGNGFDATPTREIAKRADVTTGLVFYYFPTKEALLRALIEERSVLPKITELLPKGAEEGDLRASLRSTGTELYDLIRSSNDMVRIVTSEVPHHRYIQQHWEEMLESVLSRLTAYISAISGGAISPEQAAPRARVFFSTIAFHAIFDPGYDSDRLIDELLGAVAPA